MCWALIWALCRALCWALCWLLCWVLCWVFNAFDSWNEKSLSNFLWSALDAPGGLFPGSCQCLHAYSVFVRRDWDKKVHETFYLVCSLWWKWWGKEWLLSSVSAFHGVHYHREVDTIKGDRNNRKINWFINKSVGWLGLDMSQTDLIPMLALHFFLPYPRSWKCRWKYRVFYLDLV